LLESALFGHERGAFTGAVDRHRGFFEQAHRGTLFLDEIGEMPLEVQAKLLRVLQDHSFHRVGGATTIEVDVRVVVATHRDLQALVHAGRFRQDLFFRLQGLRIHVPPLRERKEEIPYHVERLRARAGGTVPPLSVAALDALHAHSWPGNVRELENVVQRAFVLARGLRIEPEDLDLVSLDPPKDVAVRVPPVSDPVLAQPASREVGEARSQSERWHELCLYFQRDTSVRAEGLSPRRYCELFDVSRRTATRDLNNWLELGRLTCRGQKRALRYFLKAADYENDPL
ncbi:MAG TPA: sigma 54-interacting transcriptional regulator, partial [Planctomycetota bacterium]|nr:sigma 54-interacting transcriptional regulator [Planctomycetota bacterium]